VAGFQGRNTNLLNNANLFLYGWDIPSVNCFSHSFQEGMACEDFMLAFFMKRGNIQKVEYVNKT